MRWSRALLPAILVLSAFAHATAQGSRQSRRPDSTQEKDHSPSPYVITGTVVSSVDQSPVAHCRLTASQGNRTNFRGNFGFGDRSFGGNSDTFYCDEHGHFSIPLSSAGSWHLTASAHGFVTQAYLQHQNFYSAIVLTASRPTHDLQFRLSPEASITGVIVDEAGEPVRGAQITLQKIPPPTPGGAKPQVSTMPAGAGGKTDDRGVYELLQIPPGDYRLSVRARLWYAASVPAPSDNQPPIDPSLDLVYPVVWYPGVEDPERAETITLHAGDTRQADFHLSPVPSIHLRLLLPPAVTAENGRANLFPIVQQLVPGGGQIQVPVTTRTDVQGQVDVGGLTPGTYQIRVAGPNVVSSGGTVDVTSGAVRTLDLNASADQAKITVHIEELSDSDPGSRQVQVALLDPDTDRQITNPFRGDPRQGELRRDRSDKDRTLEVPPGRYEIVLQGRPNIYLTGITAKGAEVTGTSITVPAGPSNLTLHVASGRAKLSGIATTEDKPVVGAMVLLVPTTLEDPGSLRTLVQEQTNTDGSFDLNDVIPGQYILVVIDRGWDINWNDRATLLRYLPQGVPIDLTSGANLKQNVAAIVP